MAPNSRIILIRHGQAAHNPTNDFEQHDPELTELGIEQCEKLLREAFAAGEWPDFDNLTLIAISPLHRTVETGLHAFADKIKAGVKVVIFPELQETSPRPCDTGRPTAELEKLFPSVDFSECDRTNWLQKHHGFYTRENLPTRATFVRKWLHERPEKVIAVVTHSGFLRWLTPHDFPQQKDRDAYRNCEYRAYRFADIKEDDGDGGPYKLKEENWSKELRKKKRAEQDALISPSGEVVPSNELGQGQPSPSQIEELEQKKRQSVGGMDGAEDLDDGIPIVF